MKQLSKSEIKELNVKIEEQMGIADLFDKKERIEEGDGKILKDGEIVIFEHKGKLAPSLKLVMKRDVLKKVTVDMGAVKFVVGGADVMRPGITEIEEGIEENEFVVVIDENHKKPLAIGRALLNSQEMKKAEKGKVIKTIHYVGDEIWG